MWRWKNMKNPDWFRNRVSLYPCKSNDHIAVSGLMGEVCSNCGRFPSNPMTPCEKGYSCGFGYSSTTGEKSCSSGLGIFNTICFLLY